ncbi:uncharacterized protein [Nerophis lumbriciformis]|uniref:uncharacterized protein n=1 Tax=Nerophis lumbriciformis TaxID=546530 RepID=UPI003BADAEEF
MQCDRRVKRCLEPEVDVWSCKPKRVCLEAGLPDSDCPMELLPTLIRMTRQEKDGQVCVFRARSPPLPCPRCLAGEPGHINHMMPGGGGAP